MTVLIRVSVVNNIGHYNNLHRERQNPPKKLTPVEDHFGEVTYNPLIAYDYLLQKNISFPDCALKNGRKTRHFEVSPSSSAV